MIGMSDNGSVGGKVGAKADLTLQRLQPRLDSVWEETAADADRRHAFETRLKEHWGPLFSLLFRLYGDQYDFLYHI